MSLMVILSMTDPESLSVSTKYAKPKIEWVDTATKWLNREGALECWNGEQDKVAEFAKGEWVGVKKYSKEEAMADELMSDPRVKEIMAEKLTRTLKTKPGSVNHI